jgi:DNA mismatch endonuclease (patch repair protein)
MAIRSSLHGAGLRFRVDKAPLKGLKRRADIVFGADKVAVFVDGCFWHSCPEHGTAPRKNVLWWREKLRRNQIRDRDTDQRLRAEGWLVVRLWEHEDPEQAATGVRTILDEVRNGGITSPCRQNANRQRAE